MSGITATLNIAKNALAAQQYAINITGNNIANVNNEDYSRQSVELVNAISTEYGGVLLGTGVSVSEVAQTVNQLMENRLTDEISNQASLETAVSYMQVIEGYFDESSESGLNTLLSDFWNAWQDLSNNPAGTSERAQMVEQGQIISEKFNELKTQLASLSDDINSHIVSAVGTVNSLTSQIAVLNNEILAAETTGSANELKDLRNGLIDELGELIDIDIITKGDGSIIINAANGYPVVNGADSSLLSLEGDRIMWVGSQSRFDITDSISGGKLDGWLSVRDAVLPEYSALLDEMATEMIWAINEVHSQGSGLEYFSDTLTGTYSTDESGLLSTLSYGDRIDYDQDFVMWIQDASGYDTEYTKVTVDMGISEATLSNWQGMAPGAESVTYELTVTDTGLLGDKDVIQTSGEYLAQVWGTTSGDVEDALDAILAEQLLYVNLADGTSQELTIADSGADATRSAAQIAAMLNEIDGMEAYASSTSAGFDLSGISNAQNGDIVSYTLYVDGQTLTQSFTVDSAQGTLAEQFELSLEDAVTQLNNLNDDWDLYADDLVLSSEKGATLGVQDFLVLDNTGICFDNFTDFNEDDTISFTIATDGVPTTSTSVSVDLSSVSDVTDQEEMASVFYDQLSSALADGPFTIELNDAGTGVNIRVTDGSGISLSNPAGDTNSDALFDITNLSGTSTAATGNSSFEFSSAGTDVETFEALSFGTDTLGFIVPGSQNSGEPGTSVTLTETTLSAGTATTAAAIVGTVTTYMDTGTTIRSTTQSATGLFGTAGTAVTGNSILTLGGEDGFTGFDAGDTISFEIDGQLVDLTVSTAAGGTTEASLARQLYDELVNDITDDTYSFVLNGTQVSIIKSSDEDDLMEITNFSDATTGDSMLSVSTGTGTGTRSPETTTLDTTTIGADSVTAAAYGDEGVISWAKIDSDGNYTGERGTITTSDTGIYTIVEAGSETLSFEISAGTLVAGNTLQITTDETGSPAVDTDSSEATLSDWHWTLQSFADQLNRQQDSITAGVTLENELTFEVTDNQPDISYAFGDTETENNGFLAAAGINTFFEGSDASTMTMNAALDNLSYIAAGKIDAETGEISSGDNETALAIADIQYTELDITSWSYSRGNDAVSSIKTGTLDTYYSALIGIIGVDSLSVTSSLEFSETMISQLSEQRNAISAVSLDEEMINLVKYQQAYTAASKLLTTADEMITTLLSIR